jgi:hypothetical protein
MFYTFNSFWLSLIILLSSWGIYGIFGYEFCVITLMALMLMKLSNK